VPRPIILTISENNINHEVTDYINLFQMLLSEQRLKDTIYNQTMSVSRYSYKGHMYTSHITKLNKRLQKNTALSSYAF